MQFWAIFSIWQAICPLKQQRWESLLYRQVESFFAKGKQANSADLTFITTHFYVRESI